MKRERDSYPMEQYVSLKIADYDSPEADLTMTREEELISLLAEKVRDNGTENIIIDIVGIRKQTEEGKSRCE